MFNNIIIVISFILILSSCIKKDIKPLEQKYLIFNSDSSNTFATNINNNDTILPNIIYKVYDNDIFSFDRILKDSNTLNNNNAKYFNVKYSIGYYEGWSIYNYNYIETNQYILYVKDYY